MKRFYQFFTLILAAFAVIACSDQKADLQADVTAIEQVTEQGDSLKAINDLQTKLSSGELANNKEALAQTFSQIGAEYTKLKDGVAALKLKTQEGKEVQTKFTAAITKFVELTDLTAKYSVNPPTAEQAESFMKLQQESMQGLVDANNALAALKQQIAEKK